jgi:hypothetical protein
MPIAVTGAPACSIAVDIVPLEVSDTTRLEKRCRSMPLSSFSSMVSAPPRSRPVMT